MAIFRAMIKHLAGESISLALTIEENTNKVRNVHIVWNALYFGLIISRGQLVMVRMPETLRKTHHRSREDAVLFSGPFHAGHVAVTGSGVQELSG